MRDINKVIETLQGSKKFNIAIYKSGQKDNLIVSALEQILGEDSDNYIEIVDEYFLRSYECMNHSLIDLLIIPDLYHISEYDYPFIQYYQNKGGALIMSSSDLLMEEKKISRILTTPPNDDTDSYSYLCKTISKIGIRPVKADVIPCIVKFDNDFIFREEETLEESDWLAYGAKFNTTSNKLAPTPVWGSAFVERYEVTRNYEAVAGYDIMDRHINTPICFAQNWETGSRQCLFASNRDGAFFHPQNQHFSALVKAAVLFCKNKIIIRHVQPNFACYRQGEAVGIHYSIHSFSTEKSLITVELSISGEKDSFVKHKRHILLPGETVKGEVFWMPDSFHDDVYSVVMKVYNGSTLVSKAENGFVVWNDDVVQAGPVMETDGRYFKIDDEKMFLVGCNYYDSHQNAGMWALPNIGKLNADLKQMSECGMRYVRIHYHHPKWFYDFYMDKYGEVPEHYKHLGESYLPVEKHLRTLDAHIYLCQKYGMIYGGDLLTLRPKELGDPRGWIDLVDFLQIKEAVECQKEFLKLVIPRYKKVRGISWDIFNEPVELEPHGNIFIQKAWDWAKSIVRYIRDLGDDHTITVGGLKAGDDFEEVVDYMAPHAYFSDVADVAIESGIPQLLQEVWMMFHLLPEEEYKRKDAMRYSILETLKTGMAGYVPWQWTEQLAMWLDKDVSYSETADDINGSCVRFDGSIKPAGQYLKDFSMFMKDLYIKKIVENNMETSKGNLSIKSTKQVNPGECYLELRNQDVALRALARQRYKTNNFRVEAEKDCDLWIFASNERLELVKASEETSITLDLKMLPTDAILIDDTKNIRTSLRYQRNGNTLTFKLEPWQTYYWVKLLY